MSYWDSIQSAFGGGNSGTAMNNPYNNNLSFDNSQAPMPQWQQNAMTPIQGGDPALNQGMQQVSGNIGISDNYGGFGNADNTGYAGGESKWGKAFSGVAESVGKALENSSKSKQGSSGSVGGGSGFSGGGGSFQQVKVPHADLSYLQPYTSPFTAGFK